MAIGLGALASGYTGSMSDFYRMMIEQELQRRNQANQYDLSYQNWQKQQQYLQQQNAPLLQREQAWRQLQDFEHTYPQQQILTMPHLQAQWQQLRTQAGVPLATGPQGPGSMQQVGPPTGTGPGLAAVGTQQPIGPQAQLPILPQRIPLRTLAQYDQQFANTVHANTPLPMTPTGQVDSAALSRYYELIGARPPQGRNPKDVRIDAALAELQASQNDIAGIRQREPERVNRQDIPGAAPIVTPNPDYARWQRELAIAQARLNKAQATLDVLAPGRTVPQQVNPLPYTPPSIAAQRARRGGGGAQPAVGAPPVSPGIAAPPTRAVGAPPMKTMTRAELIAAARVLGIPPAKAEQEYRNRGYTITP